jgi:hypothetical protein
VWRGNDPVASFLRAIIFFSPSEMMASLSRVHRLDELRVLLHLCLKRGNPRGLLPPGLRWTSLRALAWDGRHTLVE